MDSDQELHWGDVHHWIRNSERSTTGFDGESRISNDLFLGVQREVLKEFFVFNVKKGRPSGKGDVKNQRCLHFRIAHAIILSLEL